ncbi:MAG: TAT-variant-translocated molybdopterin oxidoreductase [Phycisphaerales bacterium]
MKPLDQCPSSKKAGLPGKDELALIPSDLPRLEGQATRMWRSLDEAADTAEFRDFLHREFPAGASELSEPATRRSFLKLMGASVALAGAATVPGCRRPDHKIMPYAARVPENTIPGKPLFFATSMPLPGGGAEGLLVETHEGRPTKVEGNPLHPMNQGKSSVWAQSSVLDMYDPDRLKFPIYRPKAGDERTASWEDFRPWAVDHFAKFDATRGDGLAFIVEKKTSPTRDMLRERLRTRFPKAMWVPYSPASSDAAAAGSTIAFGAPMRELLTLTEAGKVKAKVIVSLDRDFLDAPEAGQLRNAREFAATRRVIATTDEMSRLYVVEPGFSNTGACADHRLRLAPSRVPAFAVALAKKIMEKAPGTGGALASALGGLAASGTDIPEAFVDAVAEDLLFASDGHGGKTTRTGQTVVLAGARLPAATQALVHAINGVLGNIGQTVSYVPMTQDEAAGDGIVALAKAMAEKRVKTVVCVECNPVYDAPADVDFAHAYEGVTSICLSVGSTETAAASMWSLNGAHYLESWGDTESADGTIAPIQPMIAPLYEPSLSEIEFLALIADPNGGMTAPATTTPAPPATIRPGPNAAPPRPLRVDDGYALVRQAWRQRLGASVNEAEFEKRWRRALHDGILHGSTPKPAAPTVRSDEVARAVAAMTIEPAPSAQALDVAFTTTHVHDGRFANNGWLQELPQAATRVVWDNPAMMSPKTAKELGLLPDKYNKKHPDDIYTKKYPEARVGKLDVGGRSLEIAVWLCPGMADHTVLLPLGYGRTVCGRVGDGVGFNTYAMRSSGAPWMMRGGKASATTRGYAIASTQNHWSLEGRTAILRQVDLPAWAKHGGEPVRIEPDRLYDTRKELPFGERVSHGELTHTPPNISIYPHPFREAEGKPSPQDETMNGRGAKPAPGSVYSSRPQWGMSIDLSTCTGCGACTVACQAENNIAIVGKKEVAKGREMAWIRVDRYFTGDDPNEPTRMLHQPVACVQCENAPCETVCPVNATTHGPEGINYMVYNRCIGTRYCANNCPYKVRRFNFFDYGVTRFNGDYMGKDMVEKLPMVPGHGNGSTAHNKINPNLIPPRLREKLEEISKLQKNPDVTVRSRGVMEKCTYCIQRINEARIETKLQNLGDIPDGLVQSACQQACPSGAIVFGDLLDTESHGGRGSRAREMHLHQRSYMLLGYLNTRPRTTYMVHVANPNPKLRTPIEDPFGHHDDHDSHGHEGEHGGKPSGGHSDLGVSRSSFLRDSAKALADRGYAVSLKVLGSLA